MKKTLILTLLIGILLQTSLANAYYCYQESANVSNQTGKDGNCGLNYSGMIIGSGDDYTNMFDGDDNTFMCAQSGLSCDSVGHKLSDLLNITYKNPIYIFNNDSIKYQLQLTQLSSPFNTFWSNYTLPASCVGSNFTVYFITNAGTPGNSQFGCINKTNNQNIIIDSATYKYYAGAVFWNITEQTPSLIMNSPINNFINFTGSNIFINITSGGINWYYTKVNIYDSSFNLINSTYNYINKNFTYSYNLINDGVYYINASACDLANNCNSTTTNTFRIDNKKTFNFLNDGNIVINRLITLNDTNNNKVYTTTNGTIIFNITSLNTNFIIKINETYANRTYNVIFDNVTDTLNIDLTPTITINLFDERTHNLITSNITIDLINSLTSQTSYTTTGLLITNITAGGTYTIRYGGSGYSTRFYYITFNTTNLNLNLYLLNVSGTSNITFTILDENAADVSGAYVKALKYDLGTNTYLLQEIGETSTVGSTILHLTKGDEFYKFMIELNGVLYLTTVPSYITSDSYTFQIQTNTDFTGALVEYQGATAILDFLNASNEFRLTYSFSGGVSNQVCLYILELGTLGYHNQSCTTSNAATVLLGITPVAGKTYSATAFYYPSGVKNFLIAGSTSIPKSGVGFGRFGLLIQILITTLAAFAIMIDLSLVLITVPGSLIVGYFFGLTTLGLVPIVVLTVVGLILAIMIGKRGA